MKSKLHSGLFLFLSLICSMQFTPSYASHSAGADISYTHLSGNLYRIHVSYYRDCLGIPAPTSITISISSNSCNSNASVTATPLPGTGQDISLVCMPSLSTCLGGTQIGIQKWEYEVDYAVPGQCPDWVFSFSDCCRNTAVTTLQNPGGYNIYIEAYLNNVNGDNNSPQFTNNPFIIGCSGQELHYNCGMWDAEGDSLVYSMVCPLIGPNTCVDYLPGYSALNPFSSNPPITFDYFTGDFFAFPTGSEVASIAFEIKDYRNGELIGSVRRDMMLYLFPCPETTPTATHMNGTTQQFTWVLPGDTVCFDIYSDDLDVSDSVNLSWNNVIPAASFVTTSSLHPTATFCWIPTINDVRSQPYMFTTMSRDNYCPVNQANIYSYFIYVTLDSALVFLSTGDLAEQSTLFISPNPTTGKFEIRSEAALQSIAVYNSLGECILRKQAGLEIDLSRQPAGLYILNATTAGGAMISKKILKE